MGKTLEDTEKEELPLGVVGLRNLGQPHALEVPHASLTKSLVFSNIYTVTTRTTTYTVMIGVRCGHVAG